jgi:hypothetical protein
MFGVRAKKDNRLSAKEAGYMELAGAVKDGDCERVNVPGGISQELGCCNVFQPEASDTKKFSCGTCKFEK